jgi:putative membrane protein
MDLKRVAVSGLLNFSLIYIAVVFGSFKYIEAIFGIDVLDMDWVEPARALVGVATWGASALAIILILLLSLVTGVLRTIARDYGFRLTRSTGGLRRRRGLFTLSEALIPFKRVQLSIIQSGPIARFLGWYRLEFQTLSADAGGGGNQVAVPFGRADEIQRALAEVSVEVPPTAREFTGVSRRHIVRQALRWSVLLIMPIVGAWIASPFALGLLVLLPLLVAGAALQWRHHRYCLTSTSLYVRHGVLSRRLWILPFERIEVLGVDQGPLQRRLDLATLAIDTAGASALRPLHIVNLPTTKAHGLADELLVRQRKARAALTK